MDVTPGVIMKNWRYLGSFRVVEDWRCWDLQSGCIAILGTWKGP